MSHTPGPWHFDGLVIHDSHCNILAVTVSGDRTWEEEDANSRLIVAAPDLLAALVISRGQWIHSVNAEQCLAAIAKAEKSA